MYFLIGCRISGYFDTKFTTIVQIELILQQSEDQKIDNILNLEQVYFLVTRVISEYKYFPDHARKTNDKIIYSIKKAPGVRCDWNKGFPLLFDTHMPYTFKRVHGWISL